MVMAANRHTAVRLSGLGGKWGRNYRVKELVSHRPFIPPLLHELIGWISKVFLGQGAGQERELWAHGNTGVEHHLPLQQSLYLNILPKWDTEYNLKPFPCSLVFFICLNQVLCVQSEFINAVILNATSCARRSPQSAQGLSLCTAEFIGVNRRGTGK